MLKISFIGNDGSTIEASVEDGQSVMSAAVNNGVDAIAAECGGACACGTCHCYIDEDWLDRLSPPDDFEEAMLECVSNPTPQSRLSCQVKMSAALDGLVVRLPPSQY